MEENNIKLWRLVEKTPPSQVVKAKKVGGYQFSSVRPHFQRQKATEVFGIYGRGWGIVPGTEIFERYQIGDTTLLSFRANLFFYWQGERSEFSIYATERMAYMTNGSNGQAGYLKIDDSADKKVVTNALTKGLSFLGFNADVFHGLYDDNNYISQRRSEELSYNEVEQKRELVDYVKWRKKAIADIYLSEDSNDLENKYFENLQIMKQKEDADGIIKLDGAKNKRYSELTKKV